MARSRRGGFGGGVKVTPNLAWDREGTRMLNLSVLRRLDPAVADILITAAHVVAYSFDEGEREWVRCRTGSLQSPVRFRSVAIASPDYVRARGCCRPGSLWRGRSSSSRGLCSYPESSSMDSR